MVIHSFFLFFYQKNLETLLFLIAIMETIRGKIFGSLIYTKYNNKWVKVMVKIIGSNHISLPAVVNQSSHLQSTTAILPLLPLLLRDDALLLVCMIERKGMVKKSMRLSFQVGYQSVCLSSWLLKFPAFSQQEKQVCLVRNHIIPVTMTINYWV